MNNRTFHFHFHFHQSDSNKTMTHPGYFPIKRGLHTATTRGTSLNLCHNSGVTLKLEHLAKDLFEHAQLQQY